MSDPPNHVRSRILEQAVPLEPTVFLLGSALPLVGTAVRDRCERRHVPLGSLLAATPPFWVRLPGFRIARRLVTNGEYRDFLDAMAAPGDERGPIYDTYDLWRHVWRELGCRVEQERVWLARSDGVAAYMDERYDRCESFIEAYLSSLRFETARLLAGPAGAIEPLLTPSEEMVRIQTDEGTTYAELKHDPLVDKVYAGLATRIRALAGRARPSLSSRQARCAVLEPAELDDLVAQIEDRVHAMAAAQPHLLDRQRIEPEALVFLRRCRDALGGGPPAADPLALRRILYPRTWPAPEGEPKPLFPGPEVPWADRPVTGISLYEALAFTLWLSIEAEGGGAVTLPNEAEFERAASWPDDARDDSAEGPPLDPSRKDIYPWQGSSAQDFHDFFGSENKEIQHYYASRADYERLRTATARPTSRGDRIEMLLGFGWQWTTDRFDEAERRYARFGDGRCALAFERPLKERRGLERTVQVFDYVPNRSHRHGAFVLRGAPDVVGGQGLTTRRFAASPLRGYPNVGIRWLRGT